MYFGFFVFKQRTAYELRISDWSSDVCSSDLVEVTENRAHVAVHQHAVTFFALVRLATEDLLADGLVDLIHIQVVDHQFLLVGQLETGDHEMSSIDRKSAV